MRETLAGTTPAAATDWSRHDAPSMWRMLAPQETESHWRHATGLRKLTELTATHMARLQVYRDELAEAWPPEKSGAARTFIARLDYLIDHVRKTHEVAAGNYTALTTATTTLESARKQVAAIHTEYAEKLETRRNYDALVESAKASQLPGTSLGPPPVSDGDLERLNLRARAVMADLSQTLVVAQGRLRQPIPYHSSDRWETPSGGRQPPIAATPVVAALEPPRASQKRAAADHRTRAHPMAYARQHIAPFMPPRAIPRSFGEAASSSHAQTAGTIPAPASSRALEDRRLPSSSTSSGGQHGLRPSNALPAGGVIGTPHTGADHATSPGTTRVNPPGGVITGGQSTPPPPQRGQPSEPKIKRMDADYHWATREGVPPVMMPLSVSSEIDPGPAIGLKR
ncbi:hypothetical protein GCM10009687_00490 [Asanoa iriomotensis]|uniref:PPE family protein n=1 Tax=Asanoa iriomotensis TaxID=234613 RepID=A0ABQ4CC50_9ACTN|nr:hypothetical protein Air01nite_64410 [Asanoa iriomotensis]